MIGLRNFCGSDSVSVDDGQFAILGQVSCGNDQILIRISRVRIAIAP